MSFKHTNLIFNNYGKNNLKKNAYEHTVPNVVVLLSTFLFYQ